MKAKNLLAEVIHLLEPPPAMTLSEWMAANRYFSSEESGTKPGPYDPEFAPYQNGIADALTDPEVERVVIMACTRAGKTSLVTSLIGYHGDLDPCPILYMRPRDTDCKLFSKEELTWLFQNTPCLKGKLSDNTGKDSENTLEWKRFPGGSIRLIGSNSPAALSGFAARLVICDEVDKYAPIESVGNPVDLAEGRAATYTHNKKIVHISNPSIAHTAGSKRKTIHALYLQSSQATFQIACPHCQFIQPLEWENLKFGHCRETLDDVYYRCASCEGHISEAQKRTACREALKRPGKGWVHEFPDRPIKGFNFSQLISPFSSFEEVVREWLRAEKSRDINSILRFKNEVLGLPFEEDLGLYRDSSDALYNRREWYADDLPMGVVLLTLAVDVQESWLSYTIVGWGIDREAWVIHPTRKDAEGKAVKFGRIEGDPATPGPWAALAQIIGQKFRHASGVMMGIEKVLIDTQGSKTQHVNKFLKGRGPLVQGLYGARTPGKPIITKAKRDTATNLRKWEIGTENAKTDIFQMLSTRAPGPLFIHFPWALEEDYFKELYSERKVEGRFKKIGSRRNEKLDELAYNLAAFYIATKNYSIEQRRDILAQAAEEMATPELPENPDHVLVDEEEDDPIAMPQVTPLPSMAILPPHPATVPPIPQDTPGREMTAKERYLAKIKGKSTGPAEPFWGDTIRL